MSYTAGDVPFLLQAELGIAHDYRKHSWQQVYVNKRKEWSEYISNGETSLFSLSQVHRILRQINTFLLEYCKVLSEESD